MHRRSRGKALTNNDVLRCLTWCFAHCPRDVTHELAAAIRCHDQDKGHPWLQQPRAVVVVFQGFGLAATDPALLEEMIPRLAGGPQRAYRAGALAAMLSRPEATPVVLTKLDVSGLAGRTERHLRRPTVRRSSEICTARHRWFAAYSNTGTVGADR